jgi:hypothetical protein
MGSELTDRPVRQVRAAVNYVCNPPAPGEDKLVFFSEAEENSTMQTLPGRKVTITDARGRVTSLDREGFRLVSHRSAIDDFEGIELDPDRNASYMAELLQLLAEETGAARVMMLSGAKQRFGEAATEQLAPLVNAKPARYPHADNTDASSAQLIKVFSQGIADLGMEEYSRVALYNLWRCVSPPPQDSPLAVCDARTVSPRDELPVTAVTEVLGMGEVRHETTSYMYNPDHRWYYFPDMTRDEVIIFKSHDTDEKRARRVAHTAFDDPDCPPGAPPRASVEARILALYA